ncbi:unnamed protein product [Gordionus sp. m RMFG-2023]|uniref:N-acetyltransferase 9-like protein n=1 Tax=Gordionus sp. m RMFG-2023 TaxID=3053472 RepID=UPI0030E2647D
MKKNRFTYIFGKKVILIPYKKEHVPKYHEWMKNSELRQQTGSEYLSLEKEYEMCQTWQEDDNKCTFIILNAEKYHNKSNGFKSERSNSSCLPFNNRTIKRDETEAIPISDLNDDLKSINLPLDSTHKPLNDFYTDETFNKGDDNDEFTLNSSNCSLNCGNTSKLHEIYSMVGDINLFITNNDIIKNNCNNLHNSCIKQAEINIMIADTYSRNKGLGLEAILLILKYGIEVLEISHYFVKISYENLISIDLFNKIGFTEKERSDVFNEVTLTLDISKGFSEWLNENTSESQIVDKNFNSQCMKFCFASAT